MRKNIMKFLNETFYTTQEFLRAVEGKLNSKTMAYLRDTLHLIPRPIKIGTGKGTVAYYSHSAVMHLKKILNKRNKGMTFKTIKRKFKDETVRVFVRCDYLRRQYDIQKEARVQATDSLKIKLHPHNIIKSKDSDDNDNENRIKAKVKIQNIKKEIIKDITKWNGKDTEKLDKIRKKVDELGRLAESMAFSVYIADYMNQWRRNEKAED